MNIAVVLCAKFPREQSIQRKKTFLMSGSWVCQVSSQSAVLLTVLVVPKRRWFCWLVCIGMRHASVTQFWGFQYNTYLFHSLTQMTPYTWHHRTWSYCLDGTSNILVKQVVFSPGRLPPVRMIGQFICISQSSCALMSSYTMNWKVHVQWFVYDELKV